MNIKKGCSAIPCTIREPNDAIVLNTQDIVNAFGVFFIVLLV